MFRRRIVGLSVLVAAAAGCPGIAIAGETTLANAVVQPGEFDEEAVAAIERHIEAIGGKEAVSAMTSRRMRGVVTLAFENGEQNHKGTALIIQEKPNKVHQAIVFPGFSEQVDYYDGEVAWEQLPGQKASKITGDRFESIARNADFNTWYGIGYRDRYQSLEHRGLVSIQGQSFVHVRAVRADGLIDELLFDPNSGLMRVFAEGGSIDSQDDRPMYNWILEYQEVDGLQIPSKFRQDAPGYSFVIEYQKIELNLSTGRIFKRPASLDEG